MIRSDVQRTLGDGESPTRANKVAFDRPRRRRQLRIVIAAISALAALAPEEIACYTAFNELRKYTIPKNFLIIS